MASNPSEDGNAPAVDGSALVDEPGRMEGMTVARATDEQHIKWAVFLEECAEYFRKRPTNGEDKAFWSNVYNGDNCEKIANYLRWTRYAPKTATNESIYWAKEDTWEATPVSADARSHKAPIKEE